MDRRGFLKLLGLGAAAVALPEVLVPERRFWQVPSSAPVGSRIERVGSTDLVLNADHGFTYDPGRTLTLDSVWFNGERLGVADLPRGDEALTFHTPRGPVEIRAYTDQVLFGIDARSYPDWKAQRYSEVTPEVLNNALSRGPRHCYIVTAVDAKAGTFTLSAENT